MMVNQSLERHLSSGQFPAFPCAMCWVLLLSFRSSDKVGRSFVVVVVVVVDDDLRDRSFLWFGQVRFGSRVSLVVNPGPFWVVPRRPNESL